MKKILLLIIVAQLILAGCNNSRKNTPDVHPIICILGGTPSTKDVVNLIPDSIKSNYNFISFNRPGFGGTANDELNKDMLFQLAKEAGLKLDDYGIIGISGGAPLAILIADKFNLKHCGIISGMVTKEAYFKYADKAITKLVFETSLKSYDDFEASALQFPNLEEIVKQAGAVSKDVALRACYDEFNFILSDSLLSEVNANALKIDWWHGENDVNVPIESVEEFLAKFPYSTLNIIPDATHAIDDNIYISKLLDGWK
jgi:pimeloyl-ACP methyl ester carboxylesterase